MAHGKQRENKTVSAPTPGDGTQQTREHGDALYYGPGQEPLEEFTENGPRDEDPQDRADSKDKMSEGRPTFTGSRAQ